MVPGIARRVGNKVGIHDGEPATVVFDEIFGRAAPIPEFQPDAVPLMRKKPNVVVRLDIDPEKLRQKFHRELCASCRRYRLHECPDIHVDCVVHVGKHAVRATHRGCGMLEMPFQVPVALGRLTRARDHRIDTVK